MKSAVYIDDTGTPSFKTQSKYDPGDWTSWVALILNVEQRVALTNILKEISNELYSKFGINEFHFKDIYQGKGSFRKVSLDTRLDIFDMFAAIYKEFNFPILLQSLTTDDIIRNRMQVFQSIKLDGYDFSKLPDFAFYLLLIKIRDYLLQHNYSKDIDFIIDSGKQKPNTKRKVKVLEEVTNDSELSYIASHDEPLIQFTDFVAFVINRTRWILMNNQKGSLDYEILRIGALANFNIIGIEKMKISFSDFNAEDYDSHMRAAYDRNGNLSDEAVEIIKSYRKNK